MNTWLKGRLSGFPVGLTLRVAAILAVAAGLLAGEALRGRPAHADNGPHGGYSVTTDACAGCHQTHTARAPGLLVDAALNLCLGCHDGLGADTDVVDGAYLALADRGLKAGGLTSAIMDTDWDTASSPAPVSSTHIVDGSTGTAWGNGPIDSGPGAAGFSLSCVSCHDPHGRAGTGGTATYRLLRPVPRDSGASSGVDVPDEATKTYAVSDTNNQYFGELYGDQRDPLSSWCAQCHTRHDAPPGSATNDSGDSIFAYRHMTQGSPDCALCHSTHGGPFIPPNPFGTSSQVVHSPRCVTCHVAHGTSASMGTYSGTVAWPDGTTTPSGNNRSSLLRVDSRGVCQLCHSK